ncbi:CheR family methyltransferase [Sessilibacter sp. MAH2]
MSSDTLFDSPAELANFCEFLEKICGIHLKENKHYLIGIRLRKILEEYKLNSTRDLIKKLEYGADSKLKREVIDAMTTNETFWFRDSYPFDFFENKFLPERLANTTGKIRIWSAACSTGQEPYSLAMLTEEVLSRNPQWAQRQIEIVATDISNKVLEQCKLAQYDRSEVERGLCNQRLKRYFEPVDDKIWQLAEKVRKRVTFKVLNLSDSFTSLGKFDIIYCRNVLIYFKGELKQDILTRLNRQLSSNGLLFLGASEGLSQADKLYNMINCNPGIVYQAIH